MGIDIAILARQIQELRDRQDITDVLYTYLDCADRCDFDRQYESSFHPEAVFIYQKGSEPVTARAFFDRIKSSDSLGAGFVQTMHYLSKRSARGVPTLFSTRWAENMQKPRCGQSRGGAVTLRLGFPQEFLDCRSIWFC